MAMFSSTLDMDRLAEADANLARMGIAPALVKTIKEHDFDPDALMSEANNLIETKEKLQEVASSWDGSIGGDGQWEGEAHNAALAYHECAFQWLGEIIDSLATAISWLLYMIELIFYFIRWLVSWVFWLAGWIAVVAFFVALVPVPVAQEIAAAVSMLSGAAAAISAVIAAAGWLVEALIRWMREGLTRSRSSTCGQLTEDLIFPTPPEGPIDEKKLLPSPPTWPFA